MRIPELLAPVGSFDHIKVAINSGASSIYLSGKNYGARKFAKNFTIDEIEKAVDIAHLHNVKVYVTVNTLIKEREVEDVLNYLSKLYSIGVDAVIIQDLGLVKLINEYLPNLKIHASTQMNIENQSKIDFLESKNVKRIILPREMTKEEIENIDTNMEVEIFAHGALCFSYSGQCLMSSFKGKRSGNRGSCAQPCRQKYKIEGIKRKDYYLSPCDLSLYNHLKDISNLNIACIKIEGRMRSKEYLGVIITNYRKALNKLKSNKTVESEEINLVFNRGLTEGNFMNTSKRSIRPGHVGLKIGRVIKNTKSQISIRLNDNIKSVPEKGDGLLIVKNDKDYGLDISQNPIITTLNHFNKGKFKQVKDFTRKNKVLIVKKVYENKKSDFNLKESEVYLTKKNTLTQKVKQIENSKTSYVKSKLILTLSLKNNFPILKAHLTLANKKVIKTEVKGRTAFEVPLKKSVSVETVKKQFAKVDNYPFEIVQMNINYDGTMFIPISKLNELRRDLFKKLAKEVSDSYKHENKKIVLPKQKKVDPSNEINFSFYTNNLEHLKYLNNVKRVYLEIPPKNDSLVLGDEKIDISYMVNFLKTALDISYDKNYKLIWKWPSITHDILVKSFNKTKGILKKMNYNIPIMRNDFKGKYCSYLMNISNNHGIDTLKDYEIITLSCELNLNDFKDIINNCKTPEKLEIFVQGSVEVMNSRYNLLNEHEGKMNYKNQLIDNDNIKYEVHKSISGDELVIFSKEELSLLSEITHLKEIGYTNFSIDGRYKSNEYFKIIDKYKKRLKNDKKKKELEKLI